MALIKNDKRGLVSNEIKIFIKYDISKCVFNQEWSISALPQTHTSLEIRLPETGQEGITAGNISSRGCCI